MATRATYRTKLKDLLLGLEDEGYGDFEFTDAEHNTYLDLAVSRLFPDLYKRVKESALAVTTYGTNKYGAVTVTAPDRVFLVEDAVEREAILGWRVRPTELVGLDTTCGFGTATTLTSVNVYYYDAFTLPADDSTDAAIPEAWTPIIITGALIEALSSRHDIGARPDPSQGHQEMSVVDRLQVAYDKAREKLAMSLPAATV